VFCHFYFIQSSLGYCYHAFLAWNKHTHTQMGGRAHPLSCQLLNTFCWSLCGKFKMSCNTNILSKICITHTHTNSYMTWTTDHINIYSFYIRYLVL
jgi:hypothetical protein